MKYTFWQFNDHHTNKGWNWPYINQGQTGWKAQGIAAVLVSIYGFFIISNI